MQRHLSILFLLCAGSLSADVTIRYKIDMKSAMPAVMQQVSAQLKNNSMSVQIKGSKARSESGLISSISDSSTKQMILMDPDGKKYSTATMDEYIASIVSAVPAIPEAAKQMMAAFKTKIDSKATGRTATIQGIEAEEQEITLTVDGPSIPNMPAGPMVRMVMQTWISKESEAARLPAIHEMSAYAQSAISGMNGLGGMQKFLDLLPGLGDSVQTVMKDLNKPNTIMLRTHMDMFMPAMAAMMKQMPAGSNPFGADFDPNGPLVQMNQEMVEFSTGPVADAQFQVPTEYTKEPLDEFAKNYLGRMMPAAAAK